MSEPRISEEELAELVECGTLQERCEQQGAVYSSWEILQRHAAFDLRDARARIVELEMENRRLRKEIEGHARDIQDAIQERLGDLRT